ncbi:MAG: hypothetical protein HQ526_02570 [Actinobacteria bacterium]|nr:hypothetical protein [Actinomycetota bacterium]
MSMDHANPDVLASTYSFDADRVIFDGAGADCIAIDLHNGAYFTFSPPAELVWSFVRGGGVPEHLVAEAEPVVRESLGSFIARLMADGLLVSSSGASAPVTGRADLPEELVQAATADLSYSQHTDMQDLFTIDPVHDVDATMGWPHLAEPLVRD